MKEFKAYHKNTNVLKYKRVEYSDDFSYERTYNEQGQQVAFKNSNGSSFEYKTYNEQGQLVTFKDSDGYYAIKGKKVTKAEFEAFTNDGIIEVNGIKYKRI